MAENSKKDSSSCTSSDGEEQDDTFLVSKNASMEELLALQEKIGTKAFSKKIMKMKRERKKAHKESNNYKRANKNRPRELHLQRKPAPKIKSLDPKSSKAVKSNSVVFRDPRFDDLSSKLDVVAWKKNYKFLSEMRHKEKLLLEETLKKEDHSKSEFLQLTIQRMENQEKEIKKREQEREMKKQQREATIASMKEGKRPRFISRKEKMLAHKISHFEELVKDNKVEKYLQRKEKKMRKKEL